MRIHSKPAHQHLPEHSTRTPTVFQSHLHAYAGMPQRRLCERQFYRRSHLKHHIESGACPKLGGDSLVRSPYDAEQGPAPVAESPTAHDASFEGENVEHLPLILRKAFIRRLDHWEHWLSVPSLLKELRHYCSLCHQWVADFRHVKQHFNRAHGPTPSHLTPAATELCKPFKSHLMRDNSCLRCSHKVGAPGRLIVQRTPMFQLCVAVAYLRNEQPPEQDVRRGPGPRAGGGHLYALLQHGQTGSGTPGGSLPEASSSRATVTTAGDGASRAKANESRPGNVPAAHDSATGPHTVDDEQGDLATGRNDCEAETGENASCSS